MNKDYILNMLLILMMGMVFGQSGPLDKPKLVVGIVVDQMRFDQLYKYENKYGANGFKKLMREGFNYKNTNKNYIPTFTAPGHASIYTGTTPSYHGIIGNVWYDRYKHGIRGNVEDSTELLVGTQLADNRGVSPRNLLTTTISDELRMGNNMKSKVISVSLKDRGAILPGGHTANAAYWYDWESSPGYFVTSSYYMKQLPKWVTAFNKQEKANAYLDTTWKTLFPVGEYTESAADDNPYEPALGGKSKPTFPYDFKGMRAKYKEKGTEYQLLLVSPDGNTMLTEFAMETIANEKLGTDNDTDLINISYSVTDVIGHTFGPQSVEMEDVFLRLDQNIASLLGYLDKNVGNGNYVLFLTSDHGSVPVASYLEAQKLPTGIARIGQFTNAVNGFLNSKYGSDHWIEYFKEDQLYLNRQVILARTLDLATIQQEVASFLMSMQGVRSAVTGHNLQVMDYTSSTNELLQNGYYAKRSGDVLLTFDAGIVQHANSAINTTSVKGTTHGTGYTYDTQVPMLWYGFGIPHGESVRKVATTDIAPSLAMFLNLQLPSGATGEPLAEIFK